MAHRPQAADAGPSLDAQPPDADADGRVSERGPGDRRAHSDPECGGVPSERAVPRPRPAATAVAPASSSHSRRSSALSCAVPPLGRERARPTGTRRCRPRTRTASPRCPVRAGNGSVPRWRGSRAARRRRRRRTRSARSMKGARTRSMKQHLSHRPHQRSRRSGRVLVEGAVAAAERAVVAVEVREAHGHPQLGPRAQVGEHGEPRPQRGVNQLAEAALEFLALGPLVVDRHARRRPASAPTPTTRWRAPRRPDARGRRRPAAAP